MTREELFTGVVGGTISGVLISTMLIIFAPPLAMMAKWPINEWSLTLLKSMWSSMFSSGYAWKISLIAMATGFGAFFIGPISRFFRNLSEK